jgi:hypothetical protein
MCKPFLLAFVILTAATLFTTATTTALAQTTQDTNAATTVSSQNTSDITNMGRAPRGLDGIGRLDLRIVDEAGNPVEGVRAELESRRLNGMFCESWNWTDARGVSVLPPLHMGRLTLKLKASGFEKQEVTVDPNSLDQPLRVTMMRKK